MPGDSFPITYKLLTSFCNVGNNRASLTGTVCSQALAATAMRALTTIILLGLMSCQKRQSTIVMVEKFNHDKLMDTIRFELIEKVYDSKTSVILKGNLTDTVYYFVVDSKNISEIEFMGHKSKLIDTKKFDIDGKITEVIKYRYDDKNSEDEELDFYLTTDGDILALRELAWNGYEVFLTDRNRKIIGLLTIDTTDFFKYNFKYRYM
jgi:hypothetical protein